MHYWTFIIGKTSMARGNMTLGLRIGLQPLLCRIRTWKYGYDSFITLGWLMNQMCYHYVYIVE